MPFQLPAAVIAFILDNAHILTDAEIAAAVSRILGRPYHRDAVESVRKRHGIKKIRDVGPWRVAPSGYFRA